ncbi:Phage-related repressor protein C [Neorhizobium galegae bv. officinalis]|nr:Phage-related repressor protein C [Neorhizobium galegae bv. officinalis]
MVAISYNDTMETLGSRLRYARTAKGLSQDEVAEQLGINRVNVSTWESDATRPDIRRLPDIAKIYGVTEAWLLSAQGEPPIKVERRKRGRATKQVDIVPGEQLLGTGKMPLYTGAMGGDGHVIISFDAIDYVKRPAELENVKGGYGLLIVGDSMVPAFWPGDMALVNPHLPPARMRNVILYHTPPNGGDVEAIVKQLNGWNEREWHLQQYNPLLEFTEYRQEWPVCHRVVGKYDAR